MYPKLLTWHSQTTIESISLQCYQHLALFLSRLLENFILPLKLLKTSFIIFNDISPPRLSSSCDDLVNNFSNKMMMTVDPAAPAKLKKIKKTGKQK